MAKIIKEFKEFAVKGSVIDLAVGVVIGASFAKITSSLVSDIIMPPLGMVVDEVDFSELVIVLREATEETSAVTINYGNFINTFVEFLIISFVIFIVVKQINKLKRKEEKKPAQPKEDTILLREIRDSLKKKPIK